jgi:hypothetical protein
MICDWRPCNQIICSDPAGMLREKNLAGNFVQVPLWAIVRIYSLHRGRFLSSRNPCD